MLCWGHSNTRRHTVASAPSVIVLVSVTSWEENQGVLPPPVVQMRILQMQIFELESVLPSCELMVHHVGRNHLIPVTSLFQVETESHELVDGSLIDLCGATLLWRTSEGLARTPTLKHLEALRQEINAARPQCPVGFNTLAFPSMHRKDTPDEKQPWVYLQCGHVHGYHNWGNHREEREGREGRYRECPMCRTKGPYVPLWLGCEAGFYVDAAPPTHAFNPCGHVCSEKTAAYWSQIPLPHGTHTFHAACPFCAHQLSGEQGFVRLIFQGPLD